MAMQLLTALATAENEVTLTFSEAVYYTGLLEPTDASQPQLFTVDADVGGPLGQDGSRAAPVGVAAVAAGSLPGAVAGSVMVLALDRPLTPQPAQYFVLCSTTLQNAGQTDTLDPSHSELPFGGVYRKLAVPTLDALTGVAGRDVASPDTLAATQAAILTAASLPLLGVPVVDDTGDYATDAGLVGLKKRVLRRIMFVPGATLHLGNYGAGAPSYAKRLGTAQSRSKLAHACEAQISQEPDVAAVSCSVAPNPQNNGLYFLSVLVKSRSTGKSFKLLAPITTTAYLPQAG